MASPKRSQGPRVDRRREEEEEVSHHPGAVGSVDGTDWFRGRNGLVPWTGIRYLVSLMSYLVSYNIYAGTYDAHRLGTYDTYHRGAMSREDEAFLRELTIPEEDRAKYTSQ